MNKSIISKGTPGVPDHNFMEDATGRVRHLVKLIDATDTAVTQH
jgi:hypothetical protein